jgi:drug/metabolite transporter (DMT)-like permease
VCFNHPVPDRASGRLALPALIVGASAIGLAPLLVRWAKAEGIGPNTAAFYRLALSLPILWLWARGERRAQGGRRAAPSWGARAKLAATGLLFAGDLAFWHASILRTAVANATLLVGLASSIAAVGAWLFFRERLTALLLAGLLVGLVGAGLLMGPTQRSAGQTLGGDLLSILAAFFYAGYLLGVSRLRRDFSTATTMAGTGLAAALGLLAAALLRGEIPLAPSARGWGILLALALVAQLGGQTVIAYALAHLPVSLSAVGLLVQPLVAAGLAWVFFQERLGLWQAAGGALILLAIALSSLGTPSPSPRGESLPKG